MQTTLKRSTPHLPTGVRCAECGREIKARNTKAQRMIQDRQGKVPVVCHICHEGRG